MISRLSIDINILILCNLYYAIGLKININILYIFYKDYIKINYDKLMNYIII